MDAGRIAQSPKPRRSRGIVSYLCALGALFGCVLFANAAARNSPPTGDVERGRRIYVKDGCYQCHGREGQGSPSTGSRIGPTSLTPAAFTAYVRRPRGEMPPYTAKVLSDAELDDVYAFVMSRPRPAAPALPRGVKPLDSGAIEAPHSAGRQGHWYDQ